MEDERPEASGLGHAHRARLRAAFWITAAFTVLELAGGVLTGSLALLAGGAYMFTDALGMGMALAAISAVHHPGKRHGHGHYRFRVLATLLASVVLFAGAGWVLAQSVLRVMNPVEVLARPMLVVAVAGLVANLVVYRLVRPGAEESLNVRGVHTEVLSDTVGSIGIVGAGCILQLTEWWYADPFIAVAVGMFVFPRAWRLARDAWRVVFRRSRAGDAVDDVLERLYDVPGVRDVHDLRVWTLVSGLDVASVHLSVRTGTDIDDVRDDAREALRERFGIDHATLRIGPEGSLQTCDTLAW